MTTLDLGNKKVDVGDGITVLKIGGKARDDATARLSKSLTVVRANDVPRPRARGEATPAPGPAPAAEPRGDVVTAEAGVAKAEGAFAEAKTALESAEVAYSAAQDALLDARRAVDKEAADALVAVEARLEVAQAGAAAARKALDQAREAAERSRADELSKRSEAEREAAAWRDELAQLERNKSDLAARLSKLGPAPDPAPVEEALAGLRRLRQVKPKPSSKGGELAQRWVAACEQLASLPAPPSPPEWLVTPALAALTEAREAVAEAEANLAPSTADPAKIDAVEAAHREVLEAEQRVMRKGNRQNKKRLDSAQEAERVALLTVGVTSYGEFLQRVVPGERAGGDDRIKQARAALADAEAVWEELHGGQASTEYTAAREHQQAVRAEAHAMLGREVPDDEIEEALRAQLESVVDTGWAEQALVDALRAAGAGVEGSDVEAAAEAWLASVPERREQHAAVEKEQGGIDERIAELQRLLDDAPAGSEPESESESGSADADARAGAFAELQLALDEADAAEKEAEAAVAEARRHVDASEQGKARAAGLEAEADKARVALDQARAKVADSEKALTDARKAAADAARAAEAAAKSATAPAPAPVAKRSDTSPSSVEADVWLLARLASSDAAAFVVDARALHGKRALRLLERAAKAQPVVVLGDEGGVTSWAAGLGDRATVRAV